VAGGNIQVIDDFLSKDELEKIKSIIFDVEFPIFWNDNVTNTELNYLDGANEQLDCKFNRHCFTHVLYENNKPNSNFYYDISEVFLDKLEVRALSRIKINMYPRSDTLFEHGFHKDNPYVSKGALFSLNTCDGYTHFKDYQKVNSVENRMIIFDAGKFHSSTNTTNNDRRVNINFNYF